MGGVNAGPTPHTLEDWMRREEKRMLDRERRPMPRRASDLLGPGIASHAVQLVDWSSAETAFNGFFYSVPGALNSPDSTRYWMGLTMATDEAYGQQVAWEYRLETPTLIPTQIGATRTFRPLGATREFTPWVLAPEPTMIVGVTAGAPTFEGTWVNYDDTLYRRAQFRREVDVVRLDGVVAGGTETIFILPEGYRPTARTMDAGANIEITGDGLVRRVFDGDNLLVPLGSITFQAARIPPVAGP